MALDTCARAVDTFHRNGKILLDTMALDTCARAVDTFHRICYNRKKGG